MKNNRVSILIAAGILLVVGGWFWLFVVVKGLRGDRTQIDDALVTEQVLKDELSTRSEREQISKPAIAAARTLETYMELLPIIDDTPGSSGKAEGFFTWWTKHIITDEELIGFTLAQYPLLPHGLEITLENDPSNTLTQLPQGIKSATLRHSLPGWSSCNAAWEMMMRFFKPLEDTEDQNGRTLVDGRHLLSWIIPGTFRATLSTSGIEYTPGCGSTTELEWYAKESGLILSEGGFSSEESKAPESSTSSPVVLTPEEELLLTTTEFIEFNILDQAEQACIKSILAHPQPDGLPPLTELIAICDDILISTSPDVEDEAVEDDTLNTSPDNNLDEEFEDMQTAGDLVSFIGSAEKGELPTLRIEMQVLYRPYSISNVLLEFINDDTPEFVTAFINYVANNFNMAGVSEILAVPEFFQLSSIDQEELKRLIVLAEQSGKSASGEPVTLKARLAPLDIILRRDIAPDRIYNEAIAEQLQQKLLAESGS